MKRKVFLIGISSCCFLLFSLPSALAQSSAGAEENSEVIETEIGAGDFVKVDTPRQATVRANELSTEEKQLVQINQSLKNLIDENQKLLMNNEVMETELTKLRGERMIQDNRLTALAGEREKFLKKSVEIEQEKKKYETQIEELKNELELKMATPEYQEAKHIRDLLEETGQPVAVAPGSQQATTVAQAAAIAQGPQVMDQETAELLAENQILKKDTIKLHYNLANLFFEQGKYEMAAAEYKRVTDLMPQDAATHYNLAFVAENYLNDKKTALEHYAKYVQLEPNASDATLVKNKISELKMILKTKIDSLIDTER